MELRFIVGNLGWRQVWECKVLNILMFEVLRDLFEFEVFGLRKIGNLSGEIILHGVLSDYDKL